MEQQSNRQMIQIFRRNSDNLPAVADARSLAQIRLHPERYPRYSSVPREARIEWLSFEILKYYKLSHMKPADTTVDAVALDEMMTRDQYIADLTQPEIDEAFRNGIFGRYGEFYGVTAMSLYGFLEAFIGSAEKREAAELVRKAKREDARREEEERERRKIRAEIEEAKRNGTFVPTGRAWYSPKKVDDALLESDNSAAHREKIRRQAEEILRHQ